jgi:type IV fimbrial biogenesis protein FimT
MRSVPNIPRYHIGVTLVELMVALAVFAILVTIGIPSFTNLVANNRASAAANELLSTLQFARSEAVKRNENITAASVGSDWSSQGWRVSRPGPTGPIFLRERHPQHPSVTVTGPSPVTFRPAGNVNVVAGAGSFTIAVTGSAGATRCLRLAASGRASVTPGPCS